MVRMTSSVMFDCSSTPADDGTRSYTPRSPVEIGRLTRVVENAVGFDQERGGRVVIEPRRFAPVDDAETGREGMLFGRDAFGLMTTLGIGVLVLGGLWML